MSNALKISGILLIGYIGLIFLKKDKTTDKTIEPKVVATPSVNHDTVDIVINTDDLVNALIHVESRGNDSAIGDRHLGRPSIGCLQIRPIMLREVNRILKKQKSKKRYKLNDRFSRQKSIEMFYVWKNFHHKHSDNEKIARCWNGGPNGYRSKKTLHYWSKIQKELNI